MPVDFENSSPNVCSELITSTRFAELATSFCTDYNLTNTPPLHPPLTGVSTNAGQEWISQPRAVTIAPNGNLVCVCNDSGNVFVVNNIVPAGRRA